MFEIKVNLRRRGFKENLPYGSKDGCPEELYFTGKIRIPEELFEVKNI